MRIVKIFLKIILNSRMIECSIHTDVLYWCIFLDHVWPFGHTHAIGINFQMYMSSALDSTSVNGT